MASSGSFLTSGYYSSTGNDTIYLKFSWEIVSQSTANNTSTISWKLIGSRTHTGYVNAGGFKVIIDGDFHQQIDKDVYTSDNGMKRMSEVFRGTDLYGEVELQRVHRSRIAEIADMM